MVKSLKYIFFRFRRWKLLKVNCFLNLLFFCLLVFFLTNVVFFNVVGGQFSGLFGLLCLVLSHLRALSLVNVALV